MGITHSWNGTILTVTSDSGSSSADLKGEKGDTGIRGAQGAKGRTGELTADILVDYATKEDVSTAIANAQIPEAQADLSAFTTHSQLYATRNRTCANRLYTTKIANPVSYNDISPFNYAAECQLVSKNVINTNLIYNLSNWDNYSGKWYRFYFEVEVGQTYCFTADSNRTSNYQYLYLRETNDITGTNKNVVELYKNNTKKAYGTFTAKENCRYCLLFYGATPEEDFAQFSNIQVAIGTEPDNNYTEYVEDFTDMLVEVFVNGTAYGTYTADYEGGITLPYLQGEVQIQVDNAAVVVKLGYNRDIIKAFEELRQAIISLGGNI